MKNLHGAGLLLLVALVSVGAAHAQSSEVRLAGAGIHYRVSSSDDAFVGPRGAAPDSVRQGLSLGFSVGYRQFGESGHGWLGEFEHAGDPDLDSVFDETTSASLRLTVARAGYAHRRVWSLRRAERRSFSLTVHGAATVGAANYVVGDEHGDRSVVLGLRVGLDADVHLRRFFFGWTVMVEGLVHTGGPVDLSLRMSTNIVPFGRLGFTFGDPVHRSRSG